MKFFNKWYFTIWIIILFLTLYQSYRRAPLLIIDGSTYDDKLLLHWCGTTLQEFKAMRELNGSFCPDADWLPKLVNTGKLVPIYDDIPKWLVLSSVLYNLLYLIVIDIILWFKVRKRKRPSPPS